MWSTPTLWEGKSNPYPDKVHSVNICGVVVDP